MRFPYRSEEVDFSFSEEAIARLLSQFHTGQLSTAAGYSRSDGSDGLFQIPAWVNSKPVALQLVEVAFMRMRVSVMTFGQTVHPGKPYRRYVIRNTLRGYQGDQLCYLFGPFTPEEDEAFQNESLFRQDPPPGAI